MATARVLVLALAAAFAALALGQAAQAAEPGRAEMSVDWRADVAPHAQFEPLLAKARADGRVRALVALRAQWAPDPLLARAERDGQHETIARLRDGLLATLAPGSYRVVRRYDLLPFVALELSPEALAALERAGLAAQVHEDALEQLDLGTTTQVVEATETTALGFTGVGRRIAVLDSGVDADHPFLAGRVDTSVAACFTTNDCANGIFGPGVAEPCTYTMSNACQHGTHVAGIAAGANGDPDSGPLISGVAPGATIVPVKVLSKVAHSSCAAQDFFCPVSYQADVLAGLEHVANLGNVDAVNMSFGHGAYDAPCKGKEHFYYQLATWLLVANGTAVVASSGNDGDVQGGKWGIKSPACVDGAISVGRVDNMDNVHPTSQSVPTLSLLAPGVDVLSSVDGDYDTMGGTSMAAPHVAGAIAVLRQKAPSATPSELLAALQTTGLPVTDTANGDVTPRLRLLSALVSFGDTGFGVSYAEQVQGGKLVSEGTSVRDLPGGSQSITISGLVAGDTVRKAYLYYMTAGAPDLDAAAFVNGWQYGGTLIGAARAGCDVAGGAAARVYRATVTSQVTGNGTYTIEGIAPGGVGTSLVLVVENHRTLSTRNVIIRAGAMTALAGETMTHAFDVGGPVKDVDLHVGLGQGDGDSEQTMLLGGAGAFGANAFFGSDGQGWDDRNQLVTGTGISGATGVKVVNGQLENRITSVNDCLTWAYSGIAYHDA
jgi:subtilisin family serine protease